MSSLEDKILSDSKRKLEDNFNVKMNLNSFSNHDKIIKKDLVEMFNKEFSTYYEISFVGLFQFIRKVYVKKHIKKQFEDDLDSFYNNIKSKLNEK